MDKRVIDQQLVYGINIADLVRHVKKALEENENWVCLRGPFSGGGTGYYQWIVLYDKENKE